MAKASPESGATELPEGDARAARDRSVGELVHHALEILDGVVHAVLMAPATRRGEQDLRRRFALEHPDQALVDPRRLVVVAVALEGVGETAARGIREQAAGVPGEIGPVLALGALEVS